MYSHAKTVQLAESSRVIGPNFPANPQRPSTWISQRGEVLRELPGRCVFRARLGTPDGPRIVVKEYTPRKLRHWLRTALGGYAETEAEHALAVRARGLPVVEPLGYARLADGRQILVLREEEGARDLQSLFLSGDLRGGHRHGSRDPSREGDAPGARSARRTVRARGPDSAGLFATS